METRDVVRCALFAALIAALGLAPRFDLPFAAGVPITAQTLGVMLAGVLLGARLGAASAALFVFVVACGAPFLAGGRGGLGVFASPTGGYLVGFVPGAFATGWIMQRAFLRSAFANALVASLLGGVLAIHACGAPWLAFAANLPLRAALIADATFLPGDALKAVAAAFVAQAYARAVPRQIATQARRDA